MKKILIATLLLGSSWGIAAPYFGSGFESGDVGSSGSLRDGFFIQTLIGSSTNQFVGLGSGGADGLADLDTKVVRSDSVGGEVVLPRKGDYFLRSEIFYNKDYTTFTGNDGANKARSTLAMSNVDLRFDYDKEGYLGFSVYTPKNFEHENGVKDMRGMSMLLSTYATTRSSFFVLGPYVKSPDTKAHWRIIYYTDDSSTQESSATSYEVDLGPIEPDLGKWTDFVIRYRVNPFSVTTNPAQKGIPNAMNRSFEGNKGIFQVWKSETQDGDPSNRPMRLKLNIFNQPVGLVPHQADQILHSFRIYKFGWHNNPTTVKGPIWFGFDEIRQGMVERDGTSFADVHPDGMSCPYGCDGIAEIPLPKPVSPGNFLVE